MNADLVARTARRTSARSIILVLTASLVLVACATPQTQRAATTFGHGVANLVLSPLMIATGLAQGLAFLPYTIATGLDQLNQSLIDAQAVSLDDSYRAAYGISIADSRVDSQTGQVAGGNFQFGSHRPEAMQEATQAFQRLLLAQGMTPHLAQQYALVGDYRHVRAQGRILLAVVNRPNGPQPFRARSKETGIETTFRHGQRGWLAAYERDTDGRLHDEVIDWVALEYASLKQDKAVAMLMVLAAESIKSGKRTPDYWRAEQRWLAGETTQVIAESSNKVRSVIQAS